MIRDQEYAYLFHITPPIDFGSEPTLLVAIGDGAARLSTFDELSQIDLPIVTHSFALLVDWFRARSLSLPLRILDLEVAKRLLVGRPKSDFSAEKPWDMPSMFLRFLDERFDAKQVKVALATHLAKPAFDDARNIQWMTAMAAGVSVLWDELRLELQKKDELCRFLDVETPAYNVMLRVQYRGICLDAIRRDEFLKMIEREYVNSHHQLAIGKGIDVERALVDLHYLNTHLNTPIEDAEEAAGIRAVIKARREFDETCKLLHAVFTARENKRILLRTVWTDEDLCFPMYNTMGTVTGRILAIDPQLQYLSKKYRGVITAREGYKLVHVDYSQFEPNIMASISRDPQLLALCNESDLYQRLATDLLGDSTYRKVVKLMFLAYSYGKRVGSLSEFLVGVSGSKEVAESLILERFLPHFVGIEEWKLTIEAELRKAGRAGSLLGNYRYRSHTGELTAKEKRWAISQTVQGSGSLILKKLIGVLSETLPEVFVLLPMHDALLMEVPEERVDEVTLELLACCRSVFTQICPGITPAIIEKPFAEA